MPLRTWVGVRAWCLVCCWYAVAAYAALAATSDDENGFIALTDGHVKEQWLGYGLDAAPKPWPTNWEFADGVLHAKGGGADLKTREQFDDFDLRFEWKIPPGSNSGVMYRVSQETDPAYFTGPEYQIIDDTGYADPLNPGQLTGAAYDLYPPTKSAAKPIGEWNDSRIVISDNHVQHYLNGEMVAEYELGSEDWNKRVAASKFDAWKKFGTNPRGHIDLQDHGHEVWFRNIRIKPLAGAGHSE